MRKCTALRGESDAMRRWRRGSGSIAPSCFEEVRTAVLDFDCSRRVPLRATSG
jgi:hypothetical protein